jgi:hypothetical protein
MVTSGRLLPTCQLRPTLPFSRPSGQHAAQPARTSLQEGAAPPAANGGAHAPDASPGIAGQLSARGGRIRFTDKDEHMYFWFPLLAGLSELTFDPRPEIR